MTPWYQTYFGEDTHRRFDVLKDLGLLPKTGVSHESTEQKEIPESND